MDGWQRAGALVEYPAPPKKWPHDRFDIVWVFTRKRDGTWAFSQVPQLLLAGDKHSVIK